MAKIYDHALIDSFWGFPRFIDSPTSYATLIMTMMNWWAWSKPKCCEYFQVGKNALLSRFHFAPAVTLIVCHKYWVHITPHLPLPMVACTPKNYCHLGTLSKKKNEIIWEFFPTWGGGLPKSQNFCKFTKYFFVCQIHSEVLKHVLQMGG